MGTSVWRRLGAIFLIVVVLSLGLVSAAAAAPEQAPDNTASASCAPTYYRVRYGDNLTSIAWRYGVTVWTVAAVERDLQPEPDLRGPDAGDLQVLRTPATAV